ncbi:threonine-rich GPI-anchored glycoprotein, partial [Clarias magur]
NGSALIQARMVFNSSSPVPSESLVLSAIQILLNDRLINLTDSVKLVNFTYDKISDTSYAVTLKFSTRNISMPENPELRNYTYEQVESIMNNAMNTLLNEPGAELFQPQSSHFTSSKNQVYGNMVYYFQDGDTKTPEAFLKELAPIYGSSLVQARMVFNSTSPVPSGTFILSSIQSLQKNRLTNLTDYVKILEVIYENISDTSYAVTFTFNISNISMPENLVQSNKTYNQVESIINNALNTLLNEPGEELFNSFSFFFTSSKNQINGDMEYYFQDGGTKTPKAFLNEIAPIVGKVVISIRLLFKNIAKIPSKTDVVNAAHTLLDAKVRRARDLTTQKLNEPVSINDVVYENIDNSSYSISFEFQISNVTISKDLQLQNETYDLIQNTLNTLLNTILNAKDAPPFVFPRANYMFNGTAIIADSEYIFVEGVSKWTPSGFLSEILQISGVSDFTTTAAPVNSGQTPTVQANTTTAGGSSAWILGIIIPCAIIIILIPCWILLC